MNNIKYTDIISLVVLYSFSLSPCAAGYKILALPMPCLNHVENINNDVYTTENTCGCYGQPQVSNFCFCFIYSKRIPSLDKYYGGN